MKMTILIPNYKTLALTKLCLRLIRQYTDLSLARIVVIDNHSEDESTDYLRQLNWIDLIERPPIPHEKPADAHAAALDVGLSQVTTPYVLSIHTDTLVKHPAWLNFLTEQIEKSPQIAGVGSWKLEFKPWMSRVVKSIEFSVQSFYHGLRKNNLHALAGRGDNYYYLRSHCALYRTQLLHDYGLTFSAEGQVAGKVMHKALVDAGYQMVFLRNEILGKYIEHLNHATMILNPELHPNEKFQTKGLKRIEAGLKRLNAEVVLQDDSLDH